MKVKEIPSILGKNNEYMKKYPIIGEGGFSFVYDLTDRENKVLKHSYNPNDGFRYLSDLSLAKRKRIGLRPIDERKIIGDDVYYLMPKLIPINFTEKELEYLDAINQIEYPKLLFSFRETISERIDLIKEKIAELVDVLSEESFELDITADNIMADIDGNIYLTDPVAEMS